MRKNIYLFFVLVPVVFLINGCTLNEGLKISNGLIEVYGRCTVNYELTIQPGTRVVFKEKQTFFIGGGDPGEIEFKDGGKLIAKGTAQNPIVFETAQVSFGQIYMRSSSIDDSIIEFSKLSNTVVTISNSTTIRKSKFENSRIAIEGNSSSLIEYNTFTWDNSFQVVLISMLDSTNCNIQYNNLSGSEIGISCGSLYSSIKNNNIQNIVTYAIGGPLSTNISVEGNYVANCYGQSGVDTTGSQSARVVYVNPRTSPVTEAGCGW